MDIYKKYFPDIQASQLEQLEAFRRLFKEWNEKVNLISRKDIDNLDERHILHSLSIAYKYGFLRNKTFVDVGTGGGFPGIPLAIFMPMNKFHLIDSIGKKILVVDQIIKELGLTNITCENTRSENLKRSFDYVICRAVSDFDTFVHQTKNLLKIPVNGSKKTGVIYLKGGDLTEELKRYEKEVEIIEISSFFAEPFYETKKIIFLSTNSKIMKKIVQAKL